MMALQKMVKILVEVIQHDFTKYQDEDSAIYDL